MPAPTPDDWAQIRYDYEHTDRPLAHICAEHGISTGTLRDRMRRWGWRRRRPPVPREGPPAFLIIEQRAAHFTAAPDIPPSSALPVSEDENPETAADGSADVRDQGSREVAPFVGNTLTVAPAENEGTSIVPQLQSAVASVLPAIEAAIARFADRSEYPRDMEQTARALNTMTRTLRELNALLGRQQRRW